MVGDMRHPKMQNNADLVSYLVTKNAWKGSYKRILSVGSLGITTYRKDNLKVTNQWLYQEMHNAKPDNAYKGALNQQKFSLFTGGGGGRKEQVFTSEYRNDILTDILRFRNMFSEKSNLGTRIPAVKLDWSENEKPVYLEVTPISIDQIDQPTGNRIACYTYKDIETLTPVAGLPGGLAIISGGYGRIHLFRCSEVESLIQSAIEAAMQYVGIQVRKPPTPVSLDWCRQTRLGKIATPENLISQAEFSVQKLAPYRHGKDSPPIARTLCLTDTLLIERDPISYRSICAQPLCEVFALIRYRREPHQLSIEYALGKVHTYFSSDRDSLVCSILDGVRSSGNQGVCVRSASTRRGLRVLPMSSASGEEVESMHLRFLRQPPEGVSFWEMVERFNANVAYGGLIHAVSQDGIFTENKEKLIKDALTVLLTRCPTVALEQAATDIDNACNAGLTTREQILQKLESRFQAIRRLFASKAGFEAFTQLPGIRDNLGRAVVSALGRHDDGLTHAVMDAVNALMQPMHEAADIRQEQLNKSSIMSSSSFMTQLVNLFTLHAFRGTGSLVISALLDFFTFAMCLPYSETSEGAAFETLLALVASRGRALFRLFLHPSLAIVKGAGLLMSSLIEESTDDIVADLRAMALSEGAVLQHISTACFANTNEPRNLLLRQLSRQLVSIWIENNIPAQDLMRRIFPEGLLNYLDSIEAPPRREKDHLYVRDNLQMAQEHMLRVQGKKSEPLYIIQEKIDGLLTHWRTKVGFPAATKPSGPAIEDKPVALRLTRKTRLKLGTLDTLKNGKPQVLPKELNWALFYYHFAEDHAQPDLIWNLRTRDELRDALEKEIGEYRRECDYFSFSRLEELGADVEDNMEEFDVSKVAETTRKSSVSPPDLIPSVDGEQVGIDVAAADSSFLDGDTVTATKGVKKPAPLDLLQTQVFSLLQQASMVSWNHMEFRVRYPSLSTEPQVANYFLRLLMEEDKQTTLAESEVSANPLGLSRIKNSREFFSELFRRYLQYAAAGSTALKFSSSSSTRRRSSITNPMRQRKREQKEHRLEMRCLCLNAMAIVYGRCHKEIGQVSDIPLLVHLLDRTPSAAERDCLLILLEKLILNKYNADEFLEADGVRVVSDLACLAHLHTSRAPAPTQTNILRAGDDQESANGGASTQLEWWCWKSATKTLNGTITEEGSEGPFSFNELRERLTLSKIPPTVLVFAQGLDSQPRCRIDGAFIESDDDEEEVTMSSVQASFAGQTQPSSVKKPSAKSLGWMPANKVVQLRWSVPRLLGDGNDDDKENGAENKVPSSNHDDSGSVKNVSALIGKLGFSKGAIMDHTSMCIRCVNILTLLCESSSSRDATGGIIRPLPKPRRTISHPVHLPHIVELLLTFDPPVVERVSSLLLHVIDQNPCLPRIYLSGVFYFILMYTGSNVLPIARFLKATHLLQACLAEEATRQLSALQTRSILGNILPEAMICFLENHSPEKFAEIYLGDFDTPEAIWSKEMRRFMIERLAAHLADFTPRLKSNVRAIYQYIGIPTIVYPQLTGELFCNSYYLRHLCDTVRFPDWPINDPIVLLRDILSTWRDETNKKPCKISYHDALRELDVDPDKLSEATEEAIIRRAYYQLSMKYHPDKNPNGKAKFHSINASYNFLCNRSRISDGPNRRHLQLLIRSQSILYNRHRQKLAPHKYAGYPMLIKTIALETEDKNLFGKNQIGSEEESSLLSAATELAYETIATSSLNAEEMRRDGGIQTLQDAFSRCSAMLSREEALNNQLAVNVCCHVTAFFTVSTKFQASRDCIHEIPQIVHDILRLLYFKNLPNLCCQAAACIASFCDDYWLCATVYESGGAYLLMSHILVYDFTLEESGVVASGDTNSQLMLNRLSLWCLWALGRLINGCSQSSMKRTDEDTDVENALNRLLTPHITRKLAAIGQLPAPEPTATITQSDGFLATDETVGISLRKLAKLLTTNSATPCFIWDNQCRADLSGLLDEQVKQVIKTGNADLSAPDRFVHKTFAGELLIGEIFVRIFNKQTTYTIENPKSFAIDLLRFLKKELALLPTTSDGLPATTRRVNHIESALEALRNVIRSYAGIELQCIGHFGILFSLLDMNGYTNLKLRAIMVLQSAATNLECLNDIHASNLLVSAVMLFRTLPLAHIPLIELFTHVISVNALLKELVYTGGLVYLMEALVTSEQRDVRAAACHLLSRCMSNAQLGRRIQALLGQLLPTIFPDTVKDSPDAFMPLFDGDHQNPELIWNQGCRDQLSEAITLMSKVFGEQQQRNRAIRWTLPDAYSVSYAVAMSSALLSAGLMKEADLAGLEATGGLVVVAGVYLHLYVNQPGWMLRQPDAFLDALMEKLFDAFRRLPSSASVLRLCARAACQLLNDRPGLLDGLPRKGFPHRLFDLFASVNEPEGAKTSLLLLHKMSASRLCVASMVERETISGFMHVTRFCIGEELGTLGETMFNIFNSPGCDSLVAQALKNDLIGYLLQVLHQGLPVGVSEPGQCRAYIVKALKVMQKSPLYGDKVTSRLNSDPAWAEFRDQSHALFLTNAPQSSASAYLTAGTGGNSVHSGFLTEGPQSSHSRQPPSSPHKMTGEGNSFGNIGPGGVPLAPPPPR